MFQVRTATMMKKNIAPSMDDLVLVYMNLVKGFTSIENDEERDELLTAFPPDIAPGAVRSHDRQRRLKYE